MLNGNSPKVVFQNPSTSMIAVWQSTVDLLCGQSYDKVGSLDGITGRIHHAQFSKDGSLLAVAFENTIDVWDTNGGAATLKTKLEHDIKVLFCDFNADGSRLVARCEWSVQYVVVWALGANATGDQLFWKELYVYDEVIFCLRDEYLAFCGKDGFLYLQSVDAEEEPTKVEHSTTSKFKSLAVSPDGYRAATITGDKIVVWGLENKIAELILTGHEDEVNGVRFNSTGTQLASTSDDCTVRVWDSGTGLSIAIISLTGPAYDVDFTYDGNAIACDTMYWVQIIDIASQKTLFADNRSGITCSKPLMVLM